MSYRRDFLVAQARYERFMGAVGDALFDNLITALQPDQYGKLTRYDQRLLSAALDVVAALMGHPQLINEASYLQAIFDAFEREPLTVRMAFLRFVTAARRYVH